jgi:hypothetical protein
LIEAAQARWISALTDLGGRNTFLYYKDRRAGPLDLADGPEAGAPPAAAPGLANQDLDLRNRSGLVARSSL